VEVGQFSTPLFYFLAAKKDSKTAHFIELF
jgi:hypothetical protein